MSQELPFGFAFPQFAGQSMTTYQPTFREVATDWLRRQLFSDDREGQRKAERVANVAEVMTPFGFATGIDDAKEAVGQGDYATAGLMAAMSGVPGPSPKIKAYHGSPHSFDRFSMDKIGTGEGAQAYGHGLYFAENEGVAKSYRDALTNKNIPQGKHIEKVAFNIVRAGPDKTDAELIPFVRNVYPNASDEEVLSALNKARSEQQVGSMYEVNINASPDDFLDWDKPLSEQPEAIRRMAGWSPEAEAQYRSAMGSDTDNLLAALEGDADYKPAAIPRPPGALPMDASGAQFYESSKLVPGDYRDKVAAAEKLKQAGIPGIKYLDAGSRVYDATADGMVKNYGSREKALEVAQKRLASAHYSDRAAWQKTVESLSAPETRNYVVFDDKLIEIVRKYGIAGASAMLGYNLLDGMDEAQAAQLQQIEQGSGW